MRSFNSQIRKVIARGLTSTSTPRFALLERYKTSARSSRTEVLERQRKKLELLLNHANRHVPYYRDMFRSLGITSNGAVAVDDASVLALIPPLSRKDIVSNAAALTAEDNANRKVFSNSSGGSTGEPLRFLQDQGYVEEQFAHQMLLRTWLDTEPFDHILKLWGAVRDTYAGAKPFDAKLKDFLKNRTTLNSFEMDPATMRRYLRIIDARNPSLIVAYVSSIYELARFAERENIKVQPPKYIQTSAGTLFEPMRQKIQSVFNCPVVNHYGSREVSAIATECSVQSGLHILMEHNLVEIIRDDGTVCDPGEEGEICITNLNNFAMPLIRYRIGDRGTMAEWTDCPCGVVYRKLQNVLGRTVDVFKTANGEVVDGRFFNMIIYGTPGTEPVTQYQVIQKAVDVVVYRFIATEKLADAVAQEVVRATRMVMGSSCEVRIEYVDQLETTATGKLRYVISELAEN
ncbi:MAG: phenylacetate--CoA ligase family protein [Bdellovibrionales bacterium]|nr:phenylacetate--CoA ligase family protein [Bdellovibrionales bacterium]